MTNQNKVTVSAVPFNPQTQTFTPTPIQPAVSSTSPKTDIKTFNQSMVNGIVPPNLQTPSTTVIADNLNTPKINIPFAQTGGQLKPLTNDAALGLQSLTTQTTPYSDLNQNISKTLVELLPNLQGQTQELERQKETLKLPELQKKLQEYNNQILTKQAELQQADINLAQGLQNIEDQTIPMEFITGQQLSVSKRADLARGLKVSEINTLNALAQAAQGNVALAQQQAQSATEAKFAPFKEMYNILIEQQKAIQPFVTSEEKKLAQQNQNMYEIAIKQVEYKQKQEDKFNDLVLQSIQNGADDLTINKARQAYQQTGSLTGAASILGPFGGKDYLANQDLFTGIRNNTYTTVGSLTQDNGFTLDDFKKGIATVESGLNYNALGPVTSKGNRAYGKYQVMDFNIPTWTKETLGTSMTPQQFLNSPNAQEKVFEFQSMKNYAKYGNWDDVASVWFSGQPLKNNYSSDGFNTVPEYVSKMRRAMGVTDTPQQLGVSPVVQSWAKDVVNGKADIKDVPKPLQNAVQVYKTQLAVDSPETRELETQYKNVIKALNSTALPVGVGPNIFSRGAQTGGGVVQRFISGVAPGAGVGAVAGAPFAGVGAIPGAIIGGIGGGILAAGQGVNETFLKGETQNFLASVDQLINKKFIDSLIEAKAKGATFGGLTEQEGQRLINAATKLNGLSVRKDGKLIGFNTSEEIFKKELNDIKEQIEATIQRNTGVRPEEGISVKTSLFLDNAIIPNLVKNTSTTKIVDYSNQFTR